MIIRVFKIILLLIIAQTLVSCSPCECDKRTELEGFYICDRKDSKNQELLWLFSDKTYLHILFYDTVQFVNSNKWMIKKDKNYGEEYFVAENWVQPCGGAVYSCDGEMEYVAKHNFKHYQYAETRLRFGCSTIGLDDEYYMRIYESSDPLYNYKRLKNQFYKVKLDMQKTKFYTETDSLVFSKVIKKRRVIIE